MNLGRRDRVASIFDTRCSNISARVRGQRSNVIHERMHHSFLSTHCIPSSREITAPFSFSLLFLFSLFLSSSFYRQLIKFLVDKCSFDFNTALQDESRDDFNTYRYISSTIEILLIHVTDRRNLFAQEI